MREILFEKVGIMSYRFVDLRRSFFPKNVMLYDQAGPEIETFAGGMKIDAGPPKFSEIKSRKVLTQIWS